MKIVDVIGLPVAAIDYAGAIDWIFKHARRQDQAYGVEAASAHVASLARIDKDFAAALAQFSLICPDGMPVKWSVNLSLAKNEKLSDRVYGPTLMLKAIEASEACQDLRHFFLGGTEETLEKLCLRFSVENPEAQIVGTYSPPFRKWSLQDTERMIEKITHSGANLIWVGFGCPKQERWIAEHLDKLPAGCYLGVGAAFAFHAGVVDQAPKCFQRFGLEWLYRLFKEPGRLWKRYLVHNTLFIYFSLIRALSRN